MASNSDEKLIAQLVHQHGQYFVEGNFDAMVSMFDKDYPKLSYLATESDQYLTSFEEIAQNFSLYADMITFSKWTIDKLFVDLITPDIAFALCLVDTEYAMKNIEAIPKEALLPYHYPTGIWSGRCRYVFHKTQDEWKIIHYEDSTNENFRSGQLHDYHEKIVANMEEQLTMLKKPKLPLQ